MAKRLRVGTPEKGKACDYKEMQRRLSDELGSKITKINDALVDLKQGNMKEFREAIAGVIGQILVPILEDQGTLISDLIEGIAGMESRIDSLVAEKAKDEERIKMLEACRESIELKSSRKEMTERVTTASKQFKVMDLDFGKESADRKELMALAKEKMLDKIRSDKKARYEELVKKASLQVLARSTTKRKQQGSEQEIWTAPILYSVEDRDTRWELEDLLRSSNVYPTFHWNREMVGVVKEMRTSLKERYTEDKHYIRIRPEERDGKWRIKADIKPKDGEGRFRLGATWDIPPMCPDVRKKHQAWIKPTWAQVTATTPKGDVASPDTFDMDL
jgi:glutaredoxin